MSASKLTADNSPPRNGLIAMYTLLSVMTLVGVKFMLDSYFHMMIDKVRAERSAIAALPVCAPNAPESDVNVNCRRGTSVMAELQDMRAHEATMLEGGQGAMPIEAAMTALAHSRENPMVAPQPSTEMAPIKGWANIPHFVSTARPTMDLTAPAPAPMPAPEPAVVDGAAVEAAPVAPPSPAGAPVAAAPAADEMTAAQAARHEARAARAAAAAAEAHAAATGEP